MVLQYVSQIRFSSVNKGMNSLGNVSTCAPLKRKKKKKTLTFESKCATQFSKVSRQPFILMQLNIMRLNVMEVSGGKYANHFLSVTQVLHKPSL